MSTEKNSILNTVGDGGMKEAWRMDRNTALSRATQYLEGIKDEYLEEILEILWAYVRRTEEKKIGN